MTNKRKMHARNVFRTPPDYTALAIKHKDFRDVCQLQLNGKVSVDYKNESALRALTQMLLLEYFQLRVVFAPGSLVPTLPLRLNYILWIEDLMAALGASSVRGVDIGCGSACIYSLLAAKKNGWQMAALESNATNITYAEQNVAANRLGARIEIFPQTDKDVIFKDFFANAGQSGDFHFCLCNPPFYDSTLADPFHGTTRNPGKRAPPHNCQTGRSEELACEGGEVQFVQRIIEESRLFQDRIRIYTSMLGHKSSLGRVVDILRGREVANFCTTEFVQGNTTRWAVAWSYASPDQLDLTADKFNFD